MKSFSFRHKNRNRTDEELLAEFLGTGNPEIMGVLFGRYLHLVLGVCLKYMREIETSKDQVMVIYEKVQEDVHRYEVWNFKNWLFVVTKNHCLMELRKRKSAGLTFSADEKELSVFMEKELDLHPLDNDEEIREKKLNDCIERLNEIQRKCISRFYFDGKCYHEIAGLFQMDEKSVKSHIQNGKRNLKICLEKKNEQE